MEDVRGLSKENLLLEGIVGMLLRPHELDAIRKQATYS